MTDELFCILHTGDVQFKLQAYKHQITRNTELEGKQSICHLIDDLCCLVQDALFPGRISGLRKPKKQENTAMYQQQLHR